MRKLASIQIITAINPIEGADQIEVAQILGWKVVIAKKDNFKVGDRVVYLEIDSLLPEKPEFEFLRKSHFRIRTVRLRKQISQGICFPISILKNYGLQEEDIYEGQDVTEIMEIVKYEPLIPANLSGEIKGHFPSWIPKTDETRIQILQTVLDKYKGTVCYVTEKLDGSSVTFYIKDGEFGVCSRNLELKATEGNTIWKACRELDIENKLKSLNINCAVQGEIIGEGIQHNKYKLKGQTIKIFNLFYIDSFSYADFKDFYLKMYELNIPIVPIIHQEYILENNMDNLIQFATDKSQLNKDLWREGIVIRPLIETIDSNISNGLLHNDRVSFKIINPEFLLKYE